MPNQSAPPGLSSHVAQFVAFANYNSRFNRAVYDVVDGLTDEERREDVGAFFGSISRTLNHILLADRIWLHRFRDVDLGGAALVGADLVDTKAGVRLDDEPFPQWADLRRERVATDAVIEAWAGSLSAAALAGTIRYGNTKGVVREHAAWIAVAHVFNHQTHHRGQVTTLLSQRGLDVGVTDFLVFETTKD